MKRHFAIFGVMVVVGCGGKIDTTPVPTPTPVPTSTTITTPVPTSRPTANPTPPPTPPSSSFPDSKECLGGGNVLVLHGEEEETLVEGNEDLTGYHFSVGQDSFEDPIEVHVFRSSTTRAWTLSFDAPGAVSPLGVGAYEKTALAVSSRDLACKPFGGRFFIQDVVRDGGTIKSLTASFEHTCQTDHTVVRGCVHVSE